MTKIDIPAYAKINLFLEITGKREDGYHNISTVMQTVELHDNISISITDSKRINISSNSLAMPCDERNIACKCAQEFFNAANIENRGLDIYIEKNIPMEAGLAGGSADGAAVLNALNELYGLPLSKDELCRTGKRAGADIPFCIMGGSMLAEGIGEILTPCARLPEAFILIAKGSKGVSTKEAYAAIDADTKRVLKKNNMPELLSEGNLEKICSGMYNCFEQLVPEAILLKNIMKKHGAINAMMSGSGSAVFGIFSDKDMADNTLNKLLSDNIFAVIC